MEGAVYYFKFSGKVIKSQRGKFKIPVNNNGLDTFVAAYDESFRKRYIMDSAIAKFKKNQVYITEFICCDLPYEIYPCKKRRIGRIRFHSPSADSASCMIDHKKVPLIANGFTEYQTYLPFFPDRIFRPLEFAFYYYFGQIKSSVLFLHGELYSAYFDLKRKLVKVTFDGYVK